MRNYLIILGLLFMCPLTVKSQEVVRLDREQAGRLARLAYKCIHTEYANNITHSMQSDKDVGTPSLLHPTFYGCYDWHSSVHGHGACLRWQNHFLPGVLWPSICNELALSMLRMRFPTLFRGIMLGPIGWLPLPFTCILPVKQINFPFQPDNIVEIAGAAFK